MKRVAIGIVAILFIFSNQAKAVEAPTNAELFTMVQQLQQTVASQAEQIRHLHVCHEETCGQLDQYKETINTLKAKLERDISGKLKKQLERMQKTGAADLSIGAGATFIGQGTSNSNAAGGSAGGTESSRFDAAYSADIEIAKQFGETGLAFLHLETGDGDTLDGDLALYPRTSVNRDADRSGNAVSLTEVWYDQLLFDSQVAITGGKIDPTSYLDTNEFANDEEAQFLNAMFRNAPTIEFPDNNFGSRIYYSPKELPGVEMSAMYVQGDGSWEQLFTKPFIGVQVSLKPEKLFNMDEALWAGNYRAYFWYNGTDHTKFTDTAKTKMANYGFGLSCDQQITDVFGIFQRIGWQDQHVGEVQFHWSLGGQMTGKYWGREQDAMAIAVGQAMPGQPYRDTNPTHTNQTQIEAYYSFKINDNLTLSPDLQCIWQPDGSSNDNRIFVYGLRGQIDM
ncbi:MAG: carbohydrate porin [Candidatus Aadella gelida]|nr:carbohydrate porin [Candidatus Aadella gelida]